MTSRIAVPYLNKPVKNSIKSIFGIKYCILPSFMVADKIYTGAI
jgi:hypothetical protein